MSSIFGPGILKGSELEKRQCVINVSRVSVLSARGPRVPEKNTRICTTKIDNFNQLYIGDNVFVQDNVYIHNVRETPKFFIIERVIISGVSLLFPSYS